MAVNRDRRLPPAKRRRQTQALADAIRQALPGIRPQAAWRIASDTMDRAGLQSVWLSAPYLPADTRARLVAVAWLRHHATEYDQVLQEQQAAAGGRVRHGEARGLTREQLAAAIAEVGADPRSLIGGG